MYAKKLKKKRFLMGLLLLIGFPVSVQATESSAPHKNNKQVKATRSFRPPRVDGGFTLLHVIPTHYAPMPRQGDKVRLTTGRVAHIKGISPTKHGGFSYTVTVRNKKSIKGFYDRHLAGLRSKLARHENELALGDIVLVERYGPRPIGKVEYLDQDWVGLNQVGNLPLDWQYPLPTNQNDQKQQPPQGGWLVPQQAMVCILDRAHRSKVHGYYDKYDKENIGLKYLLAARRPVGSLMYQVSTSRFMPTMAYFTQHATHRVLIEGKTPHTLGMEDELLLPTCTNPFQPSAAHAWVSGGLSLYTCIKKSWTAYTYTLTPTSATYTAKLCLWTPHHAAGVPLNNRLLGPEIACKPSFWCDKRHAPCRYGITLTQDRQQLVFSFANERNRRIFYNALVWLTSPYVLAIEEVNEQPTGYTRLLAVDIKKMTLKALATHMQTQWLLREGTLHQEVNFLDPHFTFEGHQQQCLSAYYGWSPQQRYKKVRISLYRTSRPDCVVYFDRYPQPNQQNKTTNICPAVARLMNQETLSLGELHTEICQGFCTYVDYLSGQNNDYTFEKAKHHMATEYHGRPTPCPEQSKCPYATLKTHQAQCHRLLYSHAPIQTYNPQTLPNNYLPFKSQEDPQEARESQYLPTQMERQGWESTQGHLQQFMHEQIRNGYLCWWAGYGTQPTTFRKLEHDYKKLLEYNPDDPSTLNLSFLDYLPLFQPHYEKLKNNVPNLYRLFYSPRHQDMGAPLTLAELAALYAYTAWDGLCSDFNRALRNRNHHKWRWMDGLLHMGITKLSFLEDAHYPLYTGFRNIRLKKTRQHDQRWQDYTSSSYYPVVAKRFHGNKGLRITIDPSIRKSPHVPCCDVSWLSPYPEEGEVLFARGTAGYTHSTTQGIDGWEVEGMGQDKQVQQVRVWHRAMFQQVPNHPLSMTDQLFGRSHSFIFDVTTYHQLIHDLIKGQPVDVNQKPGVHSYEFLLYIASTYGYTDIVGLLRQQPNININLQTQQGWSALHVAATHRHSTTQGIDGWEVEGKGQDKQVQHLRVWHEVGFQQLPNYPLSMTDQLFGRSHSFIFDVTTYHQLIHRLIKGQPVDVNQKPGVHSYEFLLYIASTYGHTDIVGLLRQQPNININLQTQQGWSVLHVAAAHRHTDIVKFLLGHEDIDINLQTLKGGSPLYVAAQQGHPPIVKLLLAVSAIQVNLATNARATPLDVVYQEMKNTRDPAVWDKYHVIWELLKNKGALLVYFALHQLQPPPQRPS